MTGKSNVPGIQPFYGLILRSIDTGNNWSIVHYDTTFRPNVVHFINELTGFAFGGYYSMYCKVYKTTNTGTNWFKIADTVSLGTTAILTVQFADNNILGNFIRSTNSGMSWELLSVLPMNNYDGALVRSVSFLNSSIGWAVGDTNLVYKTTNGGFNWTGFNTGTDNMSLHSIKMLNSSVGFTCGSNGNLFRTTDNGLFWSKINPGITSTLKSLYFSSLNTGYVCGYNGVILKTVNNGLNWSSNISGVSTNLQHTYFLNDNTGFVIGDSGVILKTNTGGTIGIEPISNKIPESYSLGQNYPNPFNPVTKIKFDISASTHSGEQIAKLLIYNSLGQLKTVLVNENLKPGEYEVSFDASDYPSGIYYYTLISGSYIESKKMVLIK
jgi:photosystem II stability/assembly factor-like uncharacterized protein